MSVDKLVDSSQLDSDLTSVANAIRTKGGTSEQLAFPAGFVSAIQAIPTGGGNEMALLGSGSYTKTGTAQSMTIPVTYSGTPRFACVIVDEEISGSAQIVSEGAYYTKADDPQNVRTVCPTGAVYFHARKAAGGYTHGGLDPNSHMELTSSSLVVSRANSTYVLQPNTYHWYIYGEAAT